MSTPQSSLAHVRQPYKHFLLPQPRDSTSSTTLKTATSALFTSNCSSVTMSLSTLRGSDILPHPHPLPPLPTVEDEEDDNVIWQPESEQDSIATTSWELLDEEEEQELELTTQQRIAHDLFASSAQSLNRVFEDTAPPVTSYVSPPRLTPDSNYESFDSSNLQAIRTPVNMSHVNGVNGAGIALPGIMSGIPTPAGHQHDLNHINNLLDEYGKVMEENRQLTARVMEGVGRVRERASTLR